MRIKRVLIYVISIICIAVFLTACGDKTFPKHDVAPGLSEYNPPSINDSLEKEETQETPVTAEPVEEPSKEDKVITIRVDHLSVFLNNVQVNYSNGHMNELGENIKSGLPEKLDDLEFHLDFSNGDYDVCLFIKNLIEELGVNQYSID